MSLKSSPSCSHSPAMSPSLSLGPAHFSFNLLVPTASEKILSYTHNFIGSRLFCTHPSKVMAICGTVLSDFFICSIVLPSVTLSKLQGQVFVKKWRDGEENPTLYLQVKRQPLGHHNDPLALYLLNWTSSALQTSMAKGESTKSDILIGPLASPMLQLSLTNAKAEQMSICWRQQMAQPSRDLLIRLVKAREMSRFCK